jgi:hypothetical protein
VFFGVLCGLIFKMLADKLSQMHNAGSRPALYVELAYTSTHRRYQYDLAGELARTLGKLRGEIR